MRPEAARADRAHAVRSAARSWHRSGAIDETTLAAIEAAYPDDRIRVGPVFRILLFLFTLLTVNAGFGLFWLIFLDRAADEATFAGISWLICSLLLALLTEYQLGSLRRSQGGTEAATSLAALGYGIASLGWLLFKLLDLPEASALHMLFFLAALLCGVAAWRWGYPLYAGSATAALLMALAGFPGGRLLWIALPVLVAPWLVRGSESRRFPPAHRQSFAAALGVALAGLYVAVHLGSFESRLIEEIRFFAPTSELSFSSDLLWWLAAAATALVPVAYLAIGIRTRRYPFLLLGLGTAVASLVTLRYYVHWALWVVLTASGAGLVAVVLALRRLLDSGPGKERKGFTAEPLFEDLGRQQLLETAAAAVTLAPEARRLGEEPRFAGGGGELGGGGSNSEF